MVRTSEQASVFNGLLSGCVASVHVSSEAVATPPTVMMDPARRTPQPRSFDRLSTGLPFSDQAAATYCRAWRISSPAANGHFVVAALALDGLEAWS